MDAVVTLAPGEVLRICDGAGRRISGLRGALWITQEGDTRDVIVKAGQDFVLDRNGLTVAQALEAVSLIMREPA
jgi:hypothetical protein